MTFFWVFVPEDSVDISTASAAHCFANPCAALRGYLGCSWFLGNSYLVVPGDGKLVHFCCLFRTLNYHENGRKYQKGSSMVVDGQEPPCFFCCLQNVGKTIDFRDSFFC